MTFGSSVKIDIDHNLVQYAAICNVRASRIIGGQKEAAARIEKVFLERAEWWSSGPYSLRVLAKMGHPYAKRGMSLRTGRTGRVSKRYANTVGDKFPNRINVQSGDFKAGWKTRINIGPKVLLVELSNTSEHAKFLTKAGTTRMVGRNPLAGIMRDSRKAVFDIERKVIPNAISGARMGRGGITGGRLRAAFMAGWRSGVTIGGLGG